MLITACAAQAESQPGAVQRKPAPEYEEDPDHFNEQNIEEVADVDETWYIKKRNVPNTGYTCHSATKLGTEGVDYIYKFSVRNATQHYIEWNVTMTPARTGKHEEPNAVRYYYLP
ncbi:hypothetical protein MTO96_045828, partial [Rhipicephalus appendiculatus]